MAKNKDDEFDFEWDDDSSFDSKLDNFDGDVGEYHGDEIKSADKDRNPVTTKLKSITPTINDAGSAFISGAGKGIGRAIEDDMPEVYQVYQQGTHILSESRIARQEISDKFRPWWNDTKRAVRRLSQQLEGQMPFGLDKKILKLVGEEDRDQQYRQPSKESLRQEQMDSNISQIFELQTQKSMEQQKDAVLNRTYDRRVDAIRHKESAGFLAKIAESSVFHQAFTNSVFTAYLKKDLELKYKQLYATEDMLGVMANHAKAVDTKLDAVIKNTALPEADKMYMSERIVGKAKENVANKFNDKLNNYFSKMRENLVGKIKDAIDWGELLTEMINQQAEVLETTNDEDMREFGGSSSFGDDSILTKNGLRKLAFGKIGDFFGKRFLRKLTSKLPQETMESLKHYFGGGRNGLALLTDDLARGRIKGLPSGLRSLLQSIAPRLNDTKQTIVNESWQTLHEGGKITNKFIQAVEEVIPGYLKMQTRYLEILATGKDSGLREWDPKKHKFLTQQESLDEFAKSISINDNDKEEVRRADIRIRNGTADTTQLIQHVSDSYGSNKAVVKDKLLKAQRTSARDIELFKVNLAHSENYWRIDESILSELNTIANAKSDSEIHETSLWKAKMFKGIDSPVNVAGFWLDILADRTRDGLVPNKVAMDHVNSLIVKERINYSGRYRAMLEQHVKDTGQWWLLDKFSKQDSSGNFIVDESAILRQQMNTTSSNNELMKKLTDEQQKFYNENFLDIKEDEKNKKNWLINWIKGIKEKLSKFDLTEFTDDIFKEGFISVYKKFNGENSEKAAEEKWKKIINDVDKIKKKAVNGYEQLSSEVKKAWNTFKIKTFYGALTVLGDNVDNSFYNLRNKLMYEEDGKEKLRDISDLTEEEWYDWFVSINNIDTVLEKFNGTSALSQVLRSVLPDHIQALLIAARNDEKLIKNMKHNVDQYSGTDAANVSKRMQLNKEVARKAIEKANKDMTARMTSHVGSTTKSNMDDDDYKILREANIKMHEDEYGKMIKVDTEKLDGNSQIDVSKEQLSILRNIDNQLGLFYQAFIDPKFKYDELLVFNKSRGKIEGNNADYMRATGVQSLLKTINDENTNESQRDKATKELEKYGFTNVHQAEEWLSSRNDVLKDTRERQEYLRHYNTGAIDNANGAILKSSAELDKLSYQEKYIEHRKMLRKHYIQLLKTTYIKDNSNNKIYTDFALLIIQNENEFLNDINATISESVIYKKVTDFILATDSDDSRRSVIRYLRLLLVKDKTLTSSIRQEDIKIGVIQEFLPIKTSDILQYALNYVKEVETHGETSANAIITKRNNAVNIDINNSSYDNIVAMHDEKEKILDDLNKQIDDTFDEDDAYVSKEDRLKGEELLISRDAAKVGLKTINTAMQNLENSHIRRVSNDKTGVYADEHSLFINELIEKDNLNYGEAIKYIENIGKSLLFKQNTGNELISNEQYADMQTVVAAVDAIKTNFSTEEDIVENGPTTLKRMLTGIYQYIKQTNKDPTLKDIKGIYHAITGKSLGDVTKYSEEAHIPTTMEDAFNRANKRKHASGGSYTKAALVYSKQLTEDKKLDDGLRKNYKYGKYLDEKYSSTDLMQIRSSLSPEEQQIFDAETADFNSNWFPRFINRLKPFRSRRLEKNTNGVPVINANKINQDIEFSSWDREYINTFLNALEMSPAVADANGKLVWAKSDRHNKLPKGILYHETSHILDNDATPTMGMDVESAHSGKGARFEKRADWNAVKRLLEAGDIKGVRGYINWLQQYADKFDPNNESDIRWRVNLLIKAAKRYGYDLNQGLKHKKFAKGDNISFGLPIDQYGGYVDQPTDILGGTGIAGEAGGETILPHKFNERFKELIYRCLKDTVGENIARRVLGMLNPSETTEDKLGILLSDNDKAKFAGGGSTAPANTNIQTDIGTANKKDEYTRRHPTDTTKNILLNIMESNEAIYSKLGDGLLVVDLAAALDKLKNTELINKLKSLKIGEKIKNFIFGTYERGKGLVGNVLGLGKRIAFGAGNNVASFGRHLVLGSKVCDVFLKSDIAGQVHGDKKISAAELEKGTIFSNAKCTKPIYSVADIYPPVYRKKTDENGNTIIEEAITEEEAKPGLVDVNGNPLTYFGGKVGRFLHNIAMKPINAIFSKSALEKVKNIGSTISSGIRHGFDGLFGAYCDVYSARDPEKMLVSGTSIKEGRLVRIPKEGAGPRVVPTVFDIDGECWIMIDDPNDATKRILGDKVIYDEDIKAGLQHRDRTPIESSKLALAMSKLRRLAGVAGKAIAGLAGGAFGIAGLAVKFAWDIGTKVAGWAKDRIKDAFTDKDPYIDVCVVKKGELEVVITGEDLKTNKATLKYCFRDDGGNYVPVLSAYGIDKPVYTKVGKNGQTLKRPRCVITKEDLDNGIFDTNGNRLTKWAGRSLAGKVSTAALGTVKLGWRAIKGIGKGIWNIGTTVVGKLGSLLGEGGAAVTSIITNAWNSTLDLFRNTIVSRKDLQEIVGDRLLDIYGLLYKYMPRKERINGDKDGDGDIDGSWTDYEQKRKERESKRLDSVHQDRPNAVNGDNMSFMSNLKNTFLSGFGGTEESSGGFLDALLGALGIKSLFSGKGAATASTTAAGRGKAGLIKRLFSPIAKLFTKPHAVDGKLESGKLYNLSKGIKEFFTGNKLTGKTGIIGAAKNKLASAGNWFKGLFSRGAATAGATSAARATATTGVTSAARATATTGVTSAAGRSIFTKLLGSLGPKVAARVAAIAGANAVPYAGQIASLGLLLWDAYEIGKWLVTDSPKTKNMRSIRCKGYGVNSKYWEAIIDLETDTFDELIDGNTNGVDRDRLIKFGYKVDFLDLNNKNSEKVEFLTTWYRKRFIPAYNFYLGCMRTVGVEFDDNPPKDDAIPEEKYAVFVTEFTKHIDKFSNGPTKLLRLDNSAYTTWLANTHEKERDEGLTSSKYSDRNLADKSISKHVENPLDTLGYAWNELKHRNFLNSLWFAGKAIISTPTYLAAKGVDTIWKNIASYFSMGRNDDQRSNNEKAWDEVRFRLYGLDKDNVSKEEYSRITSIIKEFEVNQLHVIDGEQQVLDDELKDLAKELFPAKVRKDVKNRLMLTSNFTDNVSDDLLSESRSFIFSWYKRIFVPIFTAYARVVRSACGDELGDNISIDSIPEENRLPLLKEFERQSNRFLATNIDTEILRLSSKGLYDFLVMRSEEDKAELAKDASGLLTEEETTFSDKLSRNLNKAGKDFSDAWDALKHRNVVKAIGKTVKGIGNTVIGVFKSVGTSIGESVADFLHGSKNEHTWEERFFDYGFTDRAGSTDIIANSSIKAMNEFENEAGRILLEDNTSKPDDEFFISLALDCKYIAKCCASLFGITIPSLEAPDQVIDTSVAMSRRSLPRIKEVIIRQITSKLAEDKNKAKPVEDVSQKVSDMLNYLDFWYTFRFKPVFSTFINVVSQYGVDAADIDVDDIPIESRKEALEQYKKMVGSVLKKNNIQRYSLSPEGLAVYLNELYAYREDIKDGSVDNKHNPLAVYYKEKEETYKSEVINAVVANASGLSKEDKAHVANSLAKASVEIDNELNDVSLMATISAKDALKDLGVDSLIDVNYNKAEATIVGKLMELTTGYNNYDKLGVGSGFLWDDKLGELFTDFMEDAHEYLYKGGSAEDLSEALTKFMNIYLESKVFRTDGLTQDVDTLDSIMLNKYPHVAASNATFKYFANWFSHRFIPYYTYYVTLVNKANKVDDKDEPNLGKLTSTHRRYVLMKLLGAEKKNLIPNKAKALKLTQQDMDNFYKRENALAEQRTETNNSKRKSRADLQKELDGISERYYENRDKVYAAESRSTETRGLSTIKEVNGVATGATVGDRYAKNKGTSLSAKDRQYVWDFLISQLGLTEPQAAAVMGNMMQESGLSCDVVNGIGATGICQWLGNRLYGGNGYVGLIPFAKANGLDHLSVEAQMKYLQWELTHNKYERDRFDAFVRSIPTDQNDIDKTIAQCSVGFRKGYERCGDHEAMDDKRIGYAKAMYNTFNTSGDSTNARNMNSISSVPSNIAGYSGSETSNTQINSTMNTSSSSIATASSLPSYIARYGNTDNAVQSNDDKPKYSSLDSFITKNGDSTNARNNATKDVSEGNSSLPSNIARYDNISNVTTKACDTLTTNSKEKSIGKCAKYVADALQSAGYKFNRQPSAYMYHTNGMLSGMGFECIGRTNSQPQPGDICVINRFSGHPHGHICMFNGQQWISDFKQRTPVPYKEGAPGGLWYYRPNSDTSTVKDNGFITNNESVSSSQDSIVTDTNNSIKENDALAYANAVDTIRSSLPEENAGQTPTYTYTNMTGEGDNKHILTQNAIQSSITGANNGSAPIVAELQLISKILSEFRGDVVGFINTLLAGASSSGKTEQPLSVDSNKNKDGLLTASKLDENTIKEIGDKLLTYMSGVISGATKGNITSSRNTSNMLANAYPLSSSKTR